MQQITNILNKFDSLLWGPPLLILLVGTGIYLTIRLSTIQISKLPLALKLVFLKDEDELEGEGDISSFAALCTALSATIGTGNIVGVATAVAAGGPGAIFWMWVAAFFGMATKYAEGLLAVRYRVIDENGQMSGGPMYYIERGLNNKFLAKLFALFGIGVAFFGIGTLTQVNAISNTVKISFNIPIQITVAIITVIVALVTLGGIKSISKVSEKLVPFMALFYIIGSLLIIIFNIDKLPYALNLIVKSAFTTSAAAGGFLGATAMMALKSGVSRGVFSNESGLGSAPIAAAAAKTKSCVKQGLISMTGTFFDTIVVCTMTGIVIIITGAWNMKGLEGAAITNRAFQSGIYFMPKMGELIVTVGLILFAFTTILGWNYYGERCTEYLFGVKAIKYYKLIFISIIALGSIPSLKLDLIWIVADIVNGLMAIPNLIGLIGLREIIVNETKEFFYKKGEIEKIAM